MNSFKQSALQLYYAATGRSRRRAAEQRATQGTEPVQVLFYHRVADEHPNDWTIDTATFYSQIEWIAEHFDIVHLDEAQSRIASGSNRTPTVCITFDDGYGDNCHTAIPFLLDRDIPFTYFVSTDHILRGTSFPHDVAAGIPLRPNTLDELAALAEGGIEIGSHTQSHADLGKQLSRMELEAEIGGSKDEIEIGLGYEIRYFAFPFGLHANLSQAAFEVAYDVGYQGVCSAYGAYNHPGDDAFHIRRIHGDPETIRLKNWLTVDPRKVYSQNDFSPGEYRAAPSLTS